jgi:molybdenum cofactor synthesis domain-containing protein
MAPYSVAILTLSDKGSRGEREDTSGPMLARLFDELEEFQVVKTLILPDQQERIEQTFIEWVDGDRIDLIVSTGGTGVAPTDRTPEATRAVIDFEVPGLAEAMRAASLEKTIQAVWSRAIAGVRGQSLIINLPGSEKAARENIEAILPALAHGLYKLQGGSRDCGVLV